MPPRLRMSSRLFQALDRTASPTAMERCRSLTDARNAPKRPTQRVRCRTQSSVLILTPDWRNTRSRRGRMTMAPRLTTAMVPMTPPANPG